MRDEGRPLAESLMPPALCHLPLSTGEVPARGPTAVQTGPSWPPQLCSQALK